MNMRCWHRSVNCIYGEGEKVFVRMKGKVIGWNTDHNSLQKEEWKGKKVKETCGSHWCNG